MRKLLIVALAALALLIGVVVPASAAPARPSCPTSIILFSTTEDLNVVGLDGRTAEWVVHYGKSVVQSAGCSHAGQFLVHVDDGFYTTDPGFLGNAAYLDMETSAGNWTAVAHYGGTDETTDDVPTQINMPDKGDFWVTGNGSNRNWKGRFWGVCSGTCHHYEEDQGVI